MASEYDRLVDILEGVCNYCPVCAEKLVTIETTKANWKPGDEVSSYKMCPQGHGILGVDPRWEPADGKPDAVFELNRLLFEL
jgi:hypothetical protein